MNQAALHRLLSAKQATKSKDLPNDLFHSRLAANITLIQSLFFSLYPKDQNTAYFDTLLSSLETLFTERSTALKTQDITRTNAGNWYQSEQWVGTQLYVDRYHKDIRGLQEKLPYLEDLGVNFIHLMPITTRPAGENDGGYAVNSYHNIDPKYGTKKDFTAFTKQARKQGVVLMLDFVVNHTSDEFDWAKKAKAGDKKYQNYYYTYPDRHIPDEFEKTLPEIFPASAPGNFTYNAEMGNWVMTCFNHYQWDLNYKNPEVFIAMLENLVTLANMGVDVIRFDALAFLWKKIGTNSQNLPEAHQLISLFKLCLQIVAPGTILLAEAIVAPKEIVNYFGRDTLEGNECEVAYNASLMALLWNSIATKKTTLLQKSLQEVPQKPADGTWINYIRCHDDIGLGYDDDFIRAIGWSPQEHRQFLLHYYCGNLDWSPAKGLMFMYNPKNGDGRITGSTASLLGLEEALEQNNQEKTGLAVAKILMLHGIILSYGGIPLIYAGDELGTLNDYTFLDDENHKNDSRWVNRPFQDWKVVQKLATTENHTSAIFNGLKLMVALRKSTPVFADTHPATLHHSPNPHIWVYERNNGNTKVWILSNFDKNTQALSRDWLYTIGIFPEANLVDMISGKALVFTSDSFELPPYAHLWVSVQD